ncbi:MAG: hypothetical protein R3311_19035, partial [Oceanisphaera sp.]|nr:hypothetical protein [Oceanisphaera sp.]
WLYDIIQTADGGFVAVGGSSFSGQQQDAWVIRLNAQGQRLWERHFGDSKVRDAAYSITQTSEGGFAVAGNSGDTRSALLIRLDDQGQPLWQRSFGDGKKSVGAWAIVQTDDGGFAVAGYAPSQRHGNSANVWFLQLNSMGEPN